MYERSTFAAKIGLNSFYWLMSIFFLKKKKLRKIQVTFFLSLLSIMSLEEPLKLVSQLFGKTCY